MSKTKHHPGPWKTSRHDIQGVSRLFVTVPCEPGPNFPTGTYGPMAEVLTPDSKAEANARLIAAAPELLEALKAVLADYAAEIRDNPNYNDTGRHFELSTLDKYFELIRRAGGYEE